MAAAAVPTEPASSVGLLGSVFEASLAADHGLRRSAEAELDRINQASSFVADLLSLIVSPSSVGLPVRQAGSIYLKNFLRSHYPLPSPSGHDPSRARPSISQEDRALLRSQLLVGLTSVPPSIRSLLVPTLSLIIKNDYPDRWPDLLDHILSLLSSQASSHIQSGLIALVELTRLYRWSDSSVLQPFAHLIQSSFPILLQLAQNLSAQDPRAYPLSSTPLPEDQANSEIGYILYLILKIYKTSITAYLLPFHQQTIIPWIQLFLSVSRHPLQSSPGFPVSDEERDRWGWTRAKKWTFFILNRLYSRYGSPSQLAQKMSQYKPFAEKFTDIFAPPILQLYLEQVENYVSGRDWMSRKMICHTITFFEESIRPKETWAILKPNIPNLLSNFIFPFICISVEQLEDFEHQPDQFVKSELGEFLEDLNSNPSLISSGFLLALATARKKMMFMNLLSFITEICSKYPTERNPREKDGALRAFSCLAPVLIETPSLRSRVDEFFSAYVFPEFHSPHAFLRARTCEVVRKYESAGLEWSNSELLNVALRGIMQCFADQSLPVRVQAALTFPEISEHPQVHEALTPSICNVMQELLRLSNEVDLDNLTQSVRRLVSAFSTELLPFAADMAQALNHSYLRLMSEIADARQRLGDEDEDSCEEKVLMAMGILKTLQQLIVGLEGKSAVLYQVQSSSVPLIMHTLKEEIVEIYDEALELLDSLQFATKEITPDQWALFDVVYQLFKTSGADFITEMFPVLDNYINYGSDYFLNQREQFMKLLDIYSTTITSSHLGCSDRVIACKLADSVLLCLNQQADQAIPVFLEHTMQILRRGITNVDPITTKALLMHSLEVVLNSIYRNPRLSMKILIENGWNSDFFNQWFHRFSSLKRTHDKKLSLLAICAILSISLEERAESILVQSSGQLLLGALDLFEDLPQSIRRRYELEKEYSHDDDSDNSVDGNTTVDEVSENEYLDQDGDDDVGDDDDVINHPERFVRGFRPLAKHFECGEDTSGEFAAPPSSLWSDEILWETPLDKVDAYIEFAEVMKRVEKSGHPILEIINKTLTAEQKDKLLQIMKQSGSGGETAMRKRIEEFVRDN